MNGSRGRSTLKAFAGILVTVLLIAAVGGTAYWAYVKNRKATLTARNYRSLTALGRQLEGRIDGYGEILMARRGQTSFNGCDDLKDYSSRFQCGVTAIDETASVRRAAASPRAELGVFFSRDRGETRLHLCTEAAITPAAYRIPDALRLRIPEVGELRRDEHAHVEPVCVSTTLQVLLDLLPWQRFGFDALALTTRDGTVLAQSGSLTHPIASLGSGIAAASSLQSDGADTGGGKPTAADDRTRDPQKAWPVELASQPVDTLVAGTRYLLLSWGPLPYYEGAAGTRAGETLWLVGFVPERPFANAVWRIPYAGLVTSLVALLLVALSWPLLKIWYVASRERLRALDARLVALAILSIVGIGTIVFLALDAHQRRTEEYDAHLASFAAELEHRFRVELRDASDQLSVYREPANRLCTRIPPCRGCEPPRRVVTRHLNSLLRVDQGGDTQCWFTALPGDAGIWRVQPSALTKLALGSRAYFRNAQIGALWRVKLDDGRSAPARKLAVEVVRGKASGNFELVVARPLSAPGYPQPSVIAASTNLRPLYAPILPEGIGFALVDEWGNVLLHSDYAKNLAENLFEEVDGPQLAAAVRSARPANLQISYSGNDYAVYIRPIQGAGERIPWSIVAFREKALLETLNTETLLGAVVLFGAYLSAVVVAFLGIQFLDARYRAAWLWPDRSGLAVRRYAALAFALGVVATLTYRLVGAQGMGALPLVAPAVAALAVAISCLALDPTKAERSAAAIAACTAGAIVVWSSWSSAPWFGIVLFAVCGVVYAVGRPGRRDPGAPIASETSFRAAYASFLTALIVVVAVMPAALFVDDSARYVDEAFRMVGSRHTAARLRERDARISARTGLDKDWVLKERRADKSDVYELPAQPVRASTTSAPLAGWLQEYLPALGELSAELHRSGPRQPNGQPPALSQRARAGAVLLAILLFALVWAVARRLFLLDLDASDGSGPRATPRDGAPVGWQLRRMRGPSSHAPVPVAPPATFDCRSERRSLVEWRLEHAASAKGVWRIDHFDLALEETALRTELLELIEDLVYTTDAEVVIRAGQDPIRGLVHAARAARRCAPSTTTKDGDTPQSPPPQDGGGIAVPSDASTLMRWLRVLSHFESTAFAPAVLPPTVGFSSVDQEAHHWLRWRCLSRAERLTLRQLADEGFLNPNNPEVIRSLLDDGLIRRERVFMLATPSFSRFVSRVVTADTVTRWEEETAGGGWDALRGHLASALALAGGFVFITQPDLFNNVLLTAAGVTAGVPTLLKLVSLVGEQRSASRPA